MGVVGAEVVAVVDAGDVVEVGMLEEGEAVDEVHGEVETSEGREAGDCELKPGGRDEGEDFVRNGGNLKLWGRISVLFAAHSVRIHPPDDGWRIDEGVDFEMYAEAKK